MIEWFFITMVKSAVELLATDKKFKNGFLAGMILAKKLATEKKNNAAKGGKKLQGGFSFKKALAIAAGPLGWAWLAHHNSKKAKEVKKKLEKYEPPKKTKKEKEIDDFPVDDDDDFPMENDDDFDLDDFE